MNLTEKEKRIIQLLANGYSAEQITEMVGYKSVQWLRKLIVYLREGFDCGNNEQLCVLAFKNGIIDISETSPAMVRKNSTKRRRAA
jgi:hypothetical protein